MVDNSDKQTITQFKKDDSVQFRCPSDFKREIRKLAIDRGLSMEDLCAVTISEATGIPLTSDPSPSSAA